MFSGSNPPSKPFYRGGLSRGRGGFQQGPARPNGPMHMGTNQPGMMQPGSKSFEIRITPLF